MRATLDFRPALRAAGQLVALAALLAGLAALTPAEWRPARTAPPVVSENAVTVEAVRSDARFAGALWLDARAPAAFATGHIDGAILFNEAEWDTSFAALLERWEPERVVVVYCDSPACGASERIAARLREELGVENIYALAGGWAAWSAAASAP